MLDVLGWLIFLVALLFSVMLHESGHFWTAKAFGMKCTRYFIGFGPTLWSIWIGETEYGIKALPVGGFVKIVGMTSIDEVDEWDEPRSFRRAPGWQRLIVLAAGSFMHFVLAAVLIFVLAFGIGVENDNTTQLGTVATCVPASETALENGAACTKNDATSPASLAGLKVGDTVTSFDGAKVSGWTQLSNEIKDVKAGTPVTFTVERGGHSLTLHTELVSVKGHGSYLGIAPAAVFQRQSLLGSADYVGTGFNEVVTGSFSSLAKLPAAVPYLFATCSAQQLKADKAAGKPCKDRASSPGAGVTSVVGAARDTGQAVAANVGWQAKVAFVLLLMASLNIFVGIFNMLPLLPMDGGHVAVVLWEMVRRRFARLRHRSDPGLVDYRKLVPLSFGVFVVLVAFAMTLIIADVVNPVSIG